MKFVQVSIPTEDGMVSGFSGHGVTFYSDAQSRKQIMNWMYDAHSRLPYFEKLYTQANEELIELKKQLRILGGGIG